MDPLFLTLRQVLAYHQQQLALFGGEPGVGDQGLLESAIAHPQATWFYDPHASLFDIAAGYAFHITKNHPFNDGNKRTALHAALAFLQINQIEVIAPEYAMYDAMIALTTSQWMKSQFAEFLRNNFIP